MRIRSLVAHVVMRLAQRRGYHLVPDWRMYRYPATLHLRRLFKDLKIDCVLDVGANLGQYRDFLRDEVGYSGHIISFEPIPSHAAVLRERARTDPEWSIEGCALGAAPGVALFNVMADTEFSSFLEPDHRAVTRFRSANVVEERIETRVRTVDDVIDERGPRNIYLKLDTQGFDLEVVKGASASLAGIRALQFEGSVQPIYAAMPSFTEAITRLRGLGFEVSGMFANNKGHFPLLVEIDCVMIARCFIG